MIDWQAKWIWARSLVGTPNCYVYARREFEIDAAPSATAYVTCRSAYRLSVNGRFIGRGPGRCDPGSQSCDIHDLSHAIRPGKNVVGAICYHVGDQPRAGFLLQLHIEHNGDRQVITTDESWKVKPADDWDFSSARMADHLGFQEVYDSRRKPVGWNVVGFDDRGWDDAFEVEDAENACLVLRQIPPLKEWEIHPRSIVSTGTVEPLADPPLDIATRLFREQLQPRDGAVKYPKELLKSSGDCAVINPGQDAFIILDFGVEVIGYPSIRIRAAGQATIDIGYSETLDPDGRVDPTRQGILQADRLILHGGRQEWQSLGRRVFRYVQLAIRNIDSPVSIESFQVSRVGYPTELVSGFECSDELLNEVWRTGVYTLSVCMQDSYETSPLSEPTESLADARLQALINYYCFLDSALAAQALERLVRRPDAAPTFVLMLHDYYLHTADLALVTRLYPGLRELMHGVEDCEALRAASRLAAAVSSTQDSLAWHDRAGRCAEAEHAGLNDPRSSLDVLQSLIRHERTKDALDLIRDKWGEMLRLGATTWWRDFAVQGSVSPGSLCCGSSGVPTYFLSTEILGVKPSASGIVIQPRAGDLEWAKGMVKTTYGLANVEWHRGNGVFSVEIEAPEGFIVGLPVSDFTDPIIDEVDLTPETPERRARRTYGWGNTIWRDGREHDPYLDWLATQGVEPPPGYEHGERCSSDASYIWVRDAISTHVRYEIHQP